MSSAAVPRPSPDIGIELVRDWEPESEPMADLVLLHGIGEHSGRYERTGELLAKAGIHVRSFDLIGHGGSGGRRVDIDDWGRFLDQVERHVVELGANDRPLVLMGHSMGGTLALDYVIDGRTPPDMLVVSAPALAAGARRQRLAATLLARITPTLPIAQEIKPWQLSRDPEVGDAYFSDPLVHTKGTPRFGVEFFGAMERARTGAGTIELPVLVAHGGLDTLVSPQSTAPLGELPGFERRLYPQLRHEILNEPEGPEVVADIVQWIEARLASESPLA